MHEVQNYRAKSAVNIQRNENGRENEMLAPHGLVDSLAVIRLRMVGGSTVGTELDISCIENGASGGTDVKLREKTVANGLSH
jgi:hypothetical protein